MKSARFVVACGGVLALTFAPRFAKADDLRYDGAIDVTVTTGGLFALGGSEWLLQNHAPLACAWCDRDAAGHDTLNAVDRTMRGLRWANPRAANLVSDVTAFATPLLALGSDAIAAGHDDRARGISVDFIVVTEAAVLAADLNQIAKVIVLRERPFVHALTDEERAARTKTVEDNLSFYSGHTTTTVAIAVGMGTVASLRGYRLAPLVWSTALPAALVTGYLRIGADRHYFTDVLTGAITGAAVGFLVPYLFHGHEADAMIATDQSRLISQPPLLGYACAW